MKLLVVFEYPGIADPDSAAADLVVQDVGSRTEAWSKEAGASTAWVEECFGGDQAPKEMQGAGR